MGWTIPPDAGGDVKMEWILTILIVCAIVRPDGKKILRARRR
jgi:hypothetical protein